MAEETTSGMRLSDVLVPIGLGLAAAVHPVGARGLAGLTTGVNIMAARRQQQRQEAREHQLREGLGGLRLSELFEPEEASAFQTLIKAAPVAGAQTLIPRLAEASRRRREERALTGLQGPPTIERETEVLPATEPAFPVATFEDVFPATKDLPGATFVREQIPMPPPTPAVIRRETVPLSAGTADEQLTALRERRTRHEGVLGRLTGPRQEAAERTIKRLDEQIGRLEEQVGARELNRRATALRRAAPNLSLRDAMRQAALEAQGSGFRIPSTFDKTLPDRPERPPSVTKADLALAAAAGDRTAAAALANLSDRDRAGTQVDLALQAADGDQRALAALRLLRPEQNDVNLIPRVEENTHELVIIGVDKRTGAHRFTTRPGIKVNVTADMLSQLLAAYGVTAPGAGQPPAALSPAAEEEARRYLEGR